MKNTHARRATGRGGLRWTRVVGLVAVCAASASCGGARFEPAADGSFARRLTFKTPVVVVEDPSTLPQPTRVLGTLHVAADQGVDAKRASMIMRRSAPGHGCDAVAGLRQVSPPTGPEWVGTCIRTASANSFWFLLPRMRPDPVKLGAPGDPSAVAAAGAPDAASPSPSPSATGPAPAGGGAGAQLAPSAAAPAAAPSGGQPAPARAAPTTKPAPAVTARPATPAPAAGKAPAKAAAVPRPAPRPAATTAADRAALAKRHAEEEARLKQAEADLARRKREAKRRHAEEQARLRAEAKAQAKAAKAARAARAKAAAEDKRKAKAAAKARAKAAAEERRQAKAAAKARAKAEAADKRKAKAAAKARAKAEAAERKAEAARRRAEAEQARRAAAAAKAEQARLATEAARKRAEAARAKAAAAKLAAAELRRKEAESKRRAEEARVREQRAAAAAAAQQAEAVALREGSAGGLLNFLAAYPDRISPKVQRALHAAAKKESARWLLSAGVGAVGRAPFVRIQPRRVPPTLRQDLGAAKAERWVAIAPASVTVPVQLNNPTTQPAVLALDVAGHEVHVLLPAGKQRELKLSVPCPLKGEPARVNWPGMLAYRYDCETRVSVKTRGLRAIAAELKTDRGAGSEQVTVATMAKVLKAHPATQLGPAWASWMQARLRAAAHNVGAVRLSVRRAGKGDGRSVPLEVRGHNTSRRAILALFDAGTGRVEKLRLAARKKLKLKLFGRDAKITGRVLSVLPNPRTAAWLTGVWRLGGQALLVGDDAKLALVVTLDRLTGFSSGHVAPLERSDNGFGYAMPTPMAVLRAWFGDFDMLPISCKDPCPSRLQGTLSRQDKADAGGARTLLVDILAGGRRKRLNLVSAY